MGSCSSKPEKIIVKKEVLRLNYDKKKRKLPIKIIGTKKDKLPLSSIFYKSLNNDIATVSKDGVVTMTGGGETIIRAYYPEEFLSESVLVKAEKVLGIFVEPPQMTLYTKGEKQSFKITVYNSLGQKMRKPKIRFNVGDPDVAKLHEIGELEGLKAGKTTVYMRYLEKNVKAEVIVKEGLPPFALEEKLKEKAETARADQ